MTVFMVVLGFVVVLVLHFSFRLTDQETSDVVPGENLESLLWRILAISFANICFF